MCRAVGKRGRKRVCRSKGVTANECGDNSSSTIVRPNHAQRRLVDPPTARVSRIVDLYRLFDVGGVSGNALLLRQLRLAVLLAGNFWQFAACVVWRQTELVAELAFFFSRAVNSLGARRVSADLLLL